VSAIGTAVVGQEGPRCSHEATCPASHKPGGDDISLTSEFLFLERGTPTRIFQRHKLAPSQPGLFPATGRLS
jgi:hypothetical protein